MSALREHSTLSHRKNRDTELDHESPRAANQRVVYLSTAANHRESAAADTRLTQGWLTVYTHVTARLFLCIGPEVHSYIYRTTSCSINIRVCRLSTHRSIAICSRDIQPESRVATVGDDDRQKLRLQVIWYGSPKG